MYRCMCLQSPAVGFLHELLGLVGDGILKHGGTENRLVQYPPVAEGLRDSYDCHTATTNEELLHIELILLVLRRIPLFQD